MLQRYRTVVLRGSVFACLLLCSLLIIPTAWGQNTQGTVIVTVFDPDGNVVQGAQLKLTDLGTNDVRNASTRETGSYNFINLNLGSYKLLVSKEGFESKAYDVIVQAGRITEVKSALKVGSTSSVVEVSGSAAPLVETESSATAMTIVTRQIEDLPIIGRDITVLSQLTAGYNGAWNGLPKVAEGNNIDGVIGSSSRMKFGGNSQANVTPRLENIAEMTVQTDQLDLNQGFGQSNMQINFVTRRGTNEYHGRVFEDFRNEYLNAKSYSAGLTPLAKRNEFGGSVGGPIIKDKLFLFLSYSMIKQPGSIAVDNLYFTDAAQQGTFTYGGNKTVNLFALAQAYNTAHPGASLQTVVNPVILSEFSNINSKLKAATLVPGDAGDPNLGKAYWQQSNTMTNVYPTFRIDYNVSQKVRMNLAFNQTKTQSPGGNAGYLPGDGQGAGSKANNFTSAYGMEWTISPTLINSFRGGYLYNSNVGNYNASPKYKTAPTVNWNLFYGGNWPYDGNMSGEQFNEPLNTFYPVFNLSDTVSWMKGKHAMSFGMSWYREQDHYWNAPLGFANYNLGLVNGDPALSAITDTNLPGASTAELLEAQQMYAILSGRLASVTGQTAYDPKTGGYAAPGTVSAYNLDELQKAWGLFFQDSYKVKPNLTLNYGLRWDFTGDNHDLTGFYHGSTPETIFGPSGVGNLFQPGKLTSDPLGLNPIHQARPHQYNPWNVSPQPAIGIAWSPKADGGLLKKLTGNDALVVRAGFSLRRFTEPSQYFWNAATDYGSFYYQNFSYVGSSTAIPGSYTPGTLTLQENQDPKAFPYNLTPTAYTKSEPVSNYTFSGGVPVSGLNPNIRQPYTQSWNIGIQRQLAKSTALEIRYNGNHTLHQWLNRNTNEVNIFENGFLQEFKNAQANLAINQKNGVESFANNGYAGQVALPILQAAFGGATSQFGDSTNLNWLQTGQVGSLAQLLATNPTYYCNLVGSNNFGPCSNPNNAGLPANGNGAGYAINFFQANPYVNNYAGSAANYTTDDGYSNYHALQVDLRQQAWHGLQFDANYTWSHSLGVAEQQDWQAMFPQYSNRNLRLNYAPSSFDLRHVIHVNASYDLPIGRGKKYLNHGGALDRVVGGWTIATIYQYRSGAPFRLTSGTYTYNDFADGGIVLNGITASQLQDAVGVYHQGGKNYLIDPAKLATWKADGAITANATPGTVGQIVYLHGPHQSFDDIAITKNIAINERVRFKFQTELLNAFNHPVFNTGASQRATSSSFGRANVVNNGITGAITTRRIELRANLEF